MTVNFDGDGRGDDIVVLAGRATVDRDAPGADHDDDYLEKYRTNVERTGLSLEAFAARFRFPSASASSGCTGTDGQRASVRL